jgi:light-regulated signal transduction histidine kinase (bacteriophytochrome)
MVLATPTQLMLLFQNLAGNAIKFRHKDRPVEIDVGAKLRDGSWTFWVSDNGIGTDPKYFELGIVSESVKTA